MPIVTATPAAKFIDTVGINTHIHSSTYIDETKTRSCIDYLGIKHLRDLNFSHSSTSTARLRRYMDAGYKFCIMMTTDHGSLNEQIATMASVSYGLTFLEGSNEDDITAFHKYTGDPSVRMDGVMGNGFPVGTREWQKDLYTLAKANSVLKNFPVAGPSLARDNSFAILGDLGPWSDYGNTHSYTSDGDPPGKYRQANINSSNIIAAGRPYVATEAGYHTATGVKTGNLGLSVDIHAKYIPRLYLEQFQHGWFRTYMYELMNTGNNVNVIGENWGLFYNNATPKPAATAVRAMVSILKDTGAPLNHATDSLNFTLTGMPSTGTYLLFQKQNKVFYLVLWNDVKNWSNTTQSGFNVADVAITLSIATARKAIRTYRPTISGTTATTLSATASSYSIGLPDSLIIVEIEPTGATTDPDPDPEPDPNPQPQPGSTAATIRRKNDIIGLFPDNTTGAISARDVRDAMETIYAKSYSFSVKEFGAVGDGVSRPLSSLYPSLAAAQVDYPFAVSLTDELDWAGTQAAINAAVAGGRDGGTIVSPTGRYLINRTLVLPNSPVVAAASPQMSIIWMGMGDGTRYEFTSGAPNGVTLQTHNNDSSEIAYHTIQDISFIGPGINSNTTGVWLAEGMYLRRCFFRDWKRAVSISGGPRIVERAWFGRNGVDVYYRQNNPAYRSDTLFERCLFSQWQPGDGCVLVHPTNAIGGIFETCNFGQAGYVFAKEEGSGGASPYANVVMDGVYMMHCRAEGIGNSFIVDFNQTTRCGIESVHIQSCTLRAGTIRTGIRNDALFDVGYINGLLINMPGSVDEWPARNQSMFKVSGKVQGVRIEAANRFANTSINAGKQFFIASNLSMLGGAVLEGDSMSGTLAPVVSTAISRGQVLALSGNSVVAANSASKIIGVAAHAAAIGSAVYAIDRGQASVQCTGTVTSGSWVRVDTGGRVIQASGFADGNIVGCAVSGSSGGFVTIMCDF